MAMNSPGASTPMTNEPVTLITALTAAAASTVNVLALILSWSGELVAGLNVAIAGWIVVAGFLIRARVTPNANVALTRAEAEALEPGPNGP